MGFLSAMPSSQRHIIAAGLVGLASTYGAQRLGFEQGWNAAKWDDVHAREAAGPVVSAPCVAVSPVAPVSVTPALTAPVAVRLQEPTLWLSYELSPMNPYNLPEEESLPIAGNGADGAVRSGAAAHAGESDHDWGYAPWIAVGAGGLVLAGLGVRWAWRNKIQPAMAKVTDDGTRKRLGALSAEIAALAKDERRGKSGKEAQAWFDQLIQVWGNLEKTPFTDATNGEWRAVAQSWFAIYLDILATSVTANEDAFDAIDLKDGRKMSLENEKIEGFKQTVIQQKEQLAGMLESHLLSEEQIRLAEGLKVRLEKLLSEILDRQASPTTAPKDGKPAATPVPEAAKGDSPLVSVAGTEKAKPADAKAGGATGPEVIPVGEPE